MASGDGGAGLRIGMTAAEFRALGLALDAQVPDHARLCHVPRVDQDYVDYGAVASRGGPERVAHAGLQWRWPLRGGRDGGADG